MGQNNIIELNGKRYDALTGAFLGAGAQQAASAKPKLRPAQHGRNIDGFVRGGLSNTSPLTQTVPELPKPAHQVERSGAKPAHSTPVAKKMDIFRAQPRVLAAHRPERPKTLMRSAVHKPDIKRKPAIKPQAPAELAAAPLSKIVPKASVYKISPKRLERAHHTPQSDFIKRFGSADKQVINSGVKASPTPLGQGSPQLNLAVASPPPNPPLPRLTKQSASDIFEAAIAQATSHEQKYIKPPGRRVSRRAANTIAFTAVFLVIAGFVTYVNLPNIKIHVASMNAGFHAQIPSYKPTGYALNGPIKGQGGRVVLSFRSGDSTLKLTQQASDWNSQTLLDSVSFMHPNYKTIAKQGRTVFVYGDTASWVNGGVRYDISGVSNLHADQISSIATSL